MQSSPRSSGISQALVLHHANVYTGDQKNPPVSALVIHHGQIVAMGSSRDILDEWGSGAVLQDMGGKTIWPGLIDTHLHMEKYALNLQHVDCEVPTLKECLEKVQQKARQVHPGEWILGHGWNQNDWLEGFGNASLLDQVAPENPVYLTSKSLHSAWANSKALALAQITVGTADPEGGVIQRDQAGKPTGILFESAVQLCVRVIPTPSAEQLKDAIRAAQDQLLRMGLTGVHDFDSAQCFEALQMLHEDGKLSLRVIKGIPLIDLPHVIEVGLRTGFGDDHLRIGPVKLFADGALGPRTAAMLEPYAGETDDTGILFLDSEQILDYGIQAVEHGLSLAIHAIGDRANHEVLNAYAQIRSYEASHYLPHLRHRIEHVQLLHPVDQARLAQLEIIAAMQPVHATSDMHMADQHWGSRSKDAYAWRTILNHHTALAFGSDAPVESPDPFWGLHAAVTRTRRDGTGGPNGWRPEQKISLSEALQAYTTGAAFAGGMESRVGKLAPGYLADLIVLSQDPFEIPPEALFEIKPDATMINGDWVWSKA